MLKQIFIKLIVTKIASLLWRMQVAVLSVKYID